jgi:hypothetical protein
MVVYGIVAKKKHPNCHTKPCLKNVQRAQWRGIFSPDKAIFCGHSLCMTRKIAAVWREKTRHLGMSAFFKPGRIRIGSCS